jgi:hypothetical protein
MTVKQKPFTLWHQAGVNLKGEPFVQLTKDENVIGQFTPQQAREFAMTVVEAAEAAECDAVLFRWLTEMVGSEPEKAMAAIVDFRRMRAETGKKHGALSKEDWVMPFDPTRKKQ